MTEQNTSAVLGPEFAGAAGVDTNMRTPNPVPGSHDVEILSMRRVQQLAGPGVLVMYNCGGQIRGHRISLKKDPRYALNYGVRDTKILIGAIEGFGADDPRTKAIDEAKIYRYLGPEQAGTGKLVRIEVEQGKENPKAKTAADKFFVNVRPYPAPADAVAPTRVAAGAVAAAVAAETAEVPAPPPAAAPSDGGPWFDFPEPDARRGRQQYNARNEVRDIA